MCVYVCVRVCTVVCVFVCVNRKQRVSKRERDADTHTRTPRIVYLCLVFIDIYRHQSICIDIIIFVSIFIDITLKSLQTYGLGGIVLFMLSFHCRSVTKA